MRLPRGFGIIDQRLPFVTLRVNADAHVVVAWFGYHTRGMEGSTFQVPGGKVTLSGLVTYHTPSSYRLSICGLYLPDAPSTDETEAERYARELREQHPRLNELPDVIEIEVLSLGRGRSKGLGYCRNRALLDLFSGLLGEMERDFPETAEGVSAYRTAAAIGDSNQSTGGGANTPDAPIPGYEVGVPARGPDYLRWHRIWQLVGKQAMDGKKIAAIADWLGRLHPKEKVSTKTLGYIIRAGKEGRLDRPV
ncbi:MAG TPA: hypothetical protein VHS06_03720 [Chloroflexota bacterium]|nr:hypothetical protein [Chloroflexota bacterium]